MGTLDPPPQRNKLATMPELHLSDVPGAGTGGVQPARVASICGKRPTTECCLDARLDRCALDEMLEFLAAPFLLSQTAWGSPRGCSWPMMTPTCLRRYPTPLPASVLTC